MGLLDDIIRFDAINVFGDPDAFGERMVYENADGQRFDFIGVANRQPVAPVGQTSRTPGGPLFSPKTTVCIPYDRAGQQGIPAEPVKNERIYFRLKLDQQPTWHVIASLVAQDVGGFTVSIA